MKYFLSILLLMTPLATAETKATGLVLTEMGVTYPQQHLTEFLSTGNSLRFNIFGGAKIKFGAVGLGWDITYSQYKVKDQRDGHYQTVMWDWLFIPVNIGFLQFTPGIAWVITDVNIPDLGLKEQSVRPAAVLGLGMRLGLLSNLALTAQIRAISVWEDMEPIAISQASEWNITGPAVTSTAGFMIYF